MKCEKVPEYADAFLCKCLPEEIKEEFLTHVHSCPFCRLYFERIQEIYLQMEREKAQTAGAFFYTRLEQRLLRKKERNTWIIELLPSWQPLFFALLIAIAFGVGLLAGSKFSPVSFIPTSSEILTTADEFYLNESRNEIETALLAEE